MTLYVEDFEECFPKSNGSGDWEILTMHEKSADTARARSTLMQKTWFTEWYCWWRNPAPVEVGSLSHYLQGFSTILGGCFGFLPSTVLSDQASFGYPKSQPSTGLSTFEAQCVGSVVGTFGFIWFSGARILGKQLVLPLCRLEVLELKQKRYAKNGKLKLEWIDIYIYIIWRSLDVFFSENWSIGMCECNELNVF